MKRITITIKKLLRPISVPTRKLIKFDRLKDIWTYVKGVNRAFQPFPGGMIIVSNSSGGFLERIIELAGPISTQDKWLLVSEPSSAPKEIKDSYREKYGIELPEITSIEDILNKTWTSQEYDYDLCVYPVMQNPPKYQAVLHQSLLEHVVDPVSVIKNLNDFLVPGGIQVIQTVNIYCSLHRYPIDCLRFFPDFFENLEKYIAVKCITTFMENGSIYAVLENTSE